MSDERDNPDNLVLELRERLEVLERYADEQKRKELDNRVFDLEDAKLTNLKPAGSPPDIRTSLPPELPIPEEVLPFDIEHCVMKANASGTAATVKVRPTDEKGTEYSAADDVDVFVTNDRSPQLLEDRGWKKKSTATVDGQAVFNTPKSTITLSAGSFSLSMIGQWVKYTDSGNTYEIIAFTDSTHADVTGDASDELNNDGITISGDILSFIRFSPTVSGVGGVLVGEARDKNPLPMRILNEASGGGGEYDEWEQVEIDALGVWKALDGGLTHTSTGESIWEANGTTDIATSTIVWVHLEDGDNIQYTFDYQTSETVDGLQPGDIILSGASSRAGSLLCDGTSYLRTTYPALFAAIGTVYGFADGTHFNVPDAGGRVPVGVVGGSGIVDGGGAGDLGDTDQYAAPGESGGKAWHGMTENNHPKHDDHTHGVNTTVAGIGAQDVIVATGVQSQRATNTDPMEFRHGAEITDGLHDWPVQDPVEEAHAKADTDNRQPWLTMNYFIKT